MSDEISDLRPSRAEIEAAEARLLGKAHRTPVLTSSYFDERLGAELFFKCESLQKVGAFKFRGALNAVLSLSDEERRRGVVTHSSGNHGQALALAGRLAGVRATVVSPRNAPSVKLEAMQSKPDKRIPAEFLRQARAVFLDGIADGLVLFTIPKMDDHGGVIRHVSSDPPRMHASTAPVDGTRRM